jgi:small-conductance mechanosensitive channel
VIIAMSRRRHRPPTAAMVMLIISYFMLFRSADTQTTAPSKRAAAAASTSATGPPIASTVTPEVSVVSPLASPTAEPSASARPLQAAAPFNRSQIIDYLGTVFRWRSGLADQLRLASEPEETLYVMDERQAADEVLKLAFDFARAAAALIEDQGSRPALGSGSRIEAPPAASGEVGGNLVIDDLRARRSQVQGALDQLKQQLADLRAQIARATPRERNLLVREMTAVQTRIDLAETRLASFDATIKFEAGTMATTGAAAGLDAQIDELERSAPSTASTATALQTSGLPPPLAPVAGLLGRAETVLRINRKQQDLTHAAALTDHLSQTVLQARTVLLDRLTQLDRLGLSQTARPNDQDLLGLKQTKAEFEELTRRSKLLSNAILPLSKQAMLLEVYLTSLARWRDAVRRQFNDALRGLLVRAVSLAAMLLTVFVTAALWRRLAFRYVQDLQRRTQLLQVRRVIVIVAVGLIVVFGFASELSALATVIGFAAAGIALALQNVILSLAGYFYLSGRFGVRVGDRVQVSGVNGDVLKNGFFTLTLMELDGDDSARQPTGRAIIFPNSIIFQPNTNFFRQLPGTSFAWHELSLSISPDCDYRLTEQRITEVVNDVFARDRDRIQGEYRAMENELAIRIDTPRPQVRLRLGPAGLEMVIRYPARLKGAVRASDEISRRLVDAIKREPGLRIATVGTPIIETDSGPPPEQPPSPPPPKE